MFRTSRGRLAAAGIITAIAVAAGSGIAYAGTGSDPAPGPTDTPTVAPQFGYNPHPVRARQWDFDVQQSDIGANLPTDVNRVEGTGAIPMDNWTDTQLTPNVDRFSRGPNSVTLWHDGLDLADLAVNPRTCTVTFNQDGAFRILAGTGTGAGLRSRNGEFVLQGLLSFPRIRVPYHRGQVCPLALVGSGRILRAILHNRPILGTTPTFTDFSVQGSAQVFRVTPRVHVPYATPSATATA